MSEPNTLGVSDDMDDVELIKDIEACFGVKFTDAETGRWYKVDDIFISLKTHYETGSRQNHPSGVVTAFYRLKQSIKYFDSTQNISPKTRLEEFNTVSVRELYRKLSSDHDLRQPTLYGGRVHTVGALLIMAGFLASFAFLVLWHLSYLLLAISIAVVGSVFMKFGAWRFPPDCETVGDLAQRIAARNFRLLNGSNQPVRETELWNALLEVVSDHSFIPIAEIRPDTLLLQSQLSRAERI
jgi:hypothetical protein